MEHIDNGDDLGDEWMISSILAKGEGRDKNNKKDKIEDDFDILDDNGELIENTKPMNLNNKNEEEKDKDQTKKIDVTAEVIEDDDDDEFGGHIDDYYEDDQYGH